MLPLLEQIPTNGKGEDALRPHSGAEGALSNLLWCDAADRYGGGRRLRLEVRHDFLGEQP